MFNISIASVVSKDWEATQKGNLLSGVSKGEAAAEPTTSAAIASFMVSIVGSRLMGSSRRSTNNVSPCLFNDAMGTD